MLGLSVMPYLNSCSILGVEKVNQSGKKCGFH